MGDSQFRDRVAAGLLALVLAISFVLALVQKPRQFHEVDSFFVIESMRNPVQAALGYISLSYRPPQIAGQPAQPPATGKAVELMRGAPDWLVSAMAGSAPFAKAYAQQHGGAKPPAGDVARSRRMLVDHVRADPRLGSLPGHGVYRFGEIGAIGSLPVPNAVKSALLFPLGTTYSLGPGVAYSALYATSGDYRAFLGRATTLTIILFHAGALLLFLTMRRFGIGAVAACGATIWFLLATSLFSYGFHLGSTVWMVTSSIAFLFAVASGEGARRLSLWAALLFFFNYLIILYLAAWLLVCLIRRVRDADGPAHRAKTIWAEGLRLLRECRAGLAIIVAGMLLFLQPGQGARGLMRSIGELPAYLLHAIVNLMGVAGDAASSRSLPLMLVEGAVIVALLLWSIVALARRTRAASADAGARQAGALLLALAAVYAGFCLLGLLPFTPTRHMLFIAPALFLLAAFGFDGIVRAMPASRIAQAAPMVLIAVAAGAGLLAQQARYAAMTEPRPPIDRTRFVGAFGNALPYILDTGLRPIKSADPQPMRGAVLYADTDCDAACIARHFRDAPNLGRYHIVGVQPLGDYGQDVKPIAFPAPFDDGRFVFDRWNHLHLAVLRLDAEPPKL